MYLRIVIISGWLYKKIPMPLMFGNVMMQVFDYSFVIALCLAISFSGGDVW